MLIYVKDNHKSFTFVNLYLLAKVIKDIYKNSSATVSNTLLIHFILIGKGH